MGGCFMLTEFEMGNGTDTEDRHICIEKYLVQYRDR